MPKSAAATTTAIAALPSTTTNPANVQVNLIFEGVAFSPAALRAALDAAYGTVTQDTDGAERPMGPFQFRITP
jgi:hypothetical protein